MTLETPFAYFGKKTRAAGKIWSLLGDPSHYIEPFCGSAAVLLNRPGEWASRFETINDNNFFISNFWRAVKHAPDTLADQIKIPPSEVELTALHSYLYGVAVEGERFRERLLSDCDYYDPTIAARWCYFAANSLRDNPVGRKPCKGTLVSSTRGLSALKWRDPEHYIPLLARRLQHVRIRYGGWERALTPVHLRDNPAIYFDPPYVGYENVYGLAEFDSEPLIEFCARHSDLRIVISGYDSEYDALLAYGYRKEKSRANIAGGTLANKTAASESLWGSPACSGAPVNLDGQYALPL